MSKPIRITDKMKTEAQAEFTALLKDLKMSDGEIRYIKNYTYKDASAILWLTPLVYSKTIALVNAFSDEVAWHGMAIRKSENEFIIEDICVYPQEVTGSTVNTDQARYAEWLYEFDDDAFNKIRMQGHSHVNMGVSPSGVDSGHREKILEQLDDDMFYIFMIWNKSLKTHTLIYDMENNILYDDKDITVKIIGDDSLSDFLADAETKVQKKKPAVYRAKAKKEKGKAMFDFRTRLTDAQHYAADWSDMKMVGDFIRSMEFTHDEAVAETPVSACNVALSVAPTVRMICALGAANFINFAKGNDLKKFIQIDAFSFLLDAF